MLSALDIGVCTWCLDRDDVVNGIELARSRLNVNVVQIGFFSEECVRRADSEAIVRAARNADMQLAGVFIGFEGEDYSSIASVASTGGLLPDAEYPTRRAIIGTAGELADAIGCRSLALHVGTIPADSESPDYLKLVNRAREVADMLAENGDVRLLLETGRESAATLMEFIDTLGKPNVGVNFDPANFIAYGADEPIKAVRTLGERIELVHMKDATASDRPGFSFGRPAPLGAGDATIPRLVSKLRAAEYAGPLLVECSRGHSDTASLLNALAYLGSLLA